MITVEGTGPKPARLMVVGASPGEWEARSGIAFHPRAAVGKELTRYLHQVCRIDRDAVYLTNLVPEFLNGSDITAAHIKRWESLLLRDIEEVQPEVIITLGREATRWFLGDVNLEQVYALPHTWERAEQIVIVPNYLDLYDTDRQPLIWYGFQQAARALAGQITPFKPSSLPDLNYMKATTWHDVQWIRGSQLIAIDTEGLHGNPWGLSFSTASRRAHVIKKQWIESLNEFKLWLDHPEHALYPSPTVILHSALHDLAVLRDMGINLTRFEDTQLMAFLLCLEPIGLKELAYRYRGIRRQSYLEVIGPAATLMAIDWLRKVGAHDWKDEGVEENGWTINRRVDNILGVWAGEIRLQGNASKAVMIAGKKALADLGIRVGKQNPEKNGWTDCLVDQRAKQQLDARLGLFDTSGLSKRDTAEDPIARWKVVEREHPEQVDIVEARMGPMPEAGLDTLEEIFGDEGAADAIHYSAGDADDTFTIYPILKRQIEEMDLGDAYELDLAVMPMVDRMMEVGFRADKDYFQKLGKDLAVEMNKDLDEIQKLVGTRINPNSSKQVAALLFDKMKLPVQQYTESKLPSTADEVIEALRLISNDPVLPLISDYRELSKMKGTYADKLWRWLGPDERIRTTLRMTRVPSGRLASSEPNLMAIPVRSQRDLNGVKLGKAIRRGFIPKDGCLLGSWDLDQIEMRVLAHRSKDPRLLDVFQTGEDIHQKTASLIFGLPMEQVAKGSWQRDSAKNCGFGIVYGITAKGLQLQLKLRSIDRTEQECQAMIDAYLVDAYPRVRGLMEDKKAEARRFGYVRTMLGRIRYLPGIHSANNKLRSEAERISLNHDIQGTAQEIMKLGMVGVWSRVLPLIRGEGYHCEPILQIHDELLIEADERIMPALDALVRCELQEAVKLSIPLGAKGNWASNWGELK